MAGLKNDGTPAGCVILGGGPGKGCVCLWGGGPETAGRLLELGYGEVKRDLLIGRAGDGFLETLPLTVDTARRAAGQAYVRWIYRYKPGDGWEYAELKAPVCAGTASAAAAAAEKAACSAVFTKVPLGKVDIKEELTAVLRTNYIPASARLRAIKEKYPDFFSDGPETVEVDIEFVDVELKAVERAGAERGATLEEYLRYMLVVFICMFSLAKKFPEWSRRALGLDGGEKIGDDDLALKLLLVNEKGRPGPEEPADQKNRD